jgi:hypothetical protein
MKQVRSNTTRIKHLVSDKLPDGQDIFGYAGITKASLIQAIEECSGLIDGIEGKKETFDVIVLKREFQPLSKSCLDYLNSLPADDQAHGFDSFLRNLAEIRRIINTTYLLFIKESLRPEAELATIRTALTEIIPLNQALKEQQTSTSQLIQEINEKHQEVQSKHGQIVDTSNKIGELCKSSTDLSQQIQGMHESSDEWAKSIESNEEDIDVQKTLIGEHETSIKTLQATIENKEKNFEELRTKLSQQLVKNEEFQEEIRKTIGDSNRSSMAGSFKSRSDELDKPLQDSETALVLALILFGAAALFLVTSSTGTQGINFTELSIKLPILTPFVWLAWVYTNKVGHLSRIKEDYSFKYAAAMAFEGYQRNCEEESELANRLLELSIENMGANPIRLYGKVQSGPIHEMIGKAKDIVESACSVGKKE